MKTSLLNEYINKRMTAIDLQDELKSLICKYNQLRNTYLFIYAVDFEKMGIPGLDLSISSSDYQFIHEILRKAESTSVDFYIETPGGSGTAAEDIVSFCYALYECWQSLQTGLSFLYRKFYLSLKP